MIYKIKFEDDKELYSILDKNKDKYIIKIERTSLDNILLLSDTNTSPELLLLELYNQSDKISILEAENKSLREGLQAVLSGDMQNLAYILYPEDFTDVNNTTLEL